LAFAEVLYYARLRVLNSLETVAVISLYGPPDPSLWALSSKTLWSSRALGDEGIVVVRAKDLLSVVAMIPHAPRIAEMGQGDRFFVVEKLGLDIVALGEVLGIEDDGEELDDVNES
jgi:hypothetical protein